MFFSEQLDLADRFIFDVAAFNGKSSLAAAVFFAICSREVLPSLPMHVFVDTSFDYVRQRVSALRSRDSELLLLYNLAQLKYNIEQLQKNSSLANGQILEQVARAESAEQQVAAQSMEVVTLSAKLHQIEKSWSWRLTWPFRRARKRIQSSLSWHSVEEQRASPFPEVPEQSIADATYDTIDLLFETCRQPVWDEAEQRFKLNLDAAKLEASKASSLASAGLVAPYSVRLAQPILAGSFRPAHPAHHSKRLCRRLYTTRNRPHFASVLLL